jgi:hypothetical protein
VVKGAHREDHRYGDRERKEQKQCLLPPTVHLLILCADLSLNSSFMASIETHFRAYGRSMRTAAGERQQSVPRSASLIVTW